MKIAYLDCATGIAGDMFLAALIDAGADRDTVLAALDSLGLPDVRVRIDSVVKNGFRALSVNVDHPEQHAHRHYADICRLLEAADRLTPRQRNIARDIFLAVAEAEARVHGTTVDQIHFHEVGAIDSIVDITGAAVGFDLLGIERLICSAIPTGHGRVRIAHGICPIPAPATAELLKGIPLEEVPVEAELTTPTGAAIVRTLADSFGPLPSMTIRAIGCGAGTMTFPHRANLLRLIVGDASVTPQTEVITLLETNLDDVSGEIIGHTRDTLMTAGALDVYTTPVQMKKNRPGLILSVIARPADAAALESILFEQTGTLGVRHHRLERSVAHRDHVDVSTPWGTVRCKRSWRTGGPIRFSPEFEDCARAAAESGVPLRDVYRAAESAFRQMEQAQTIPEQNPSSLTHGHDHDHDHSRDGHHHDHDDHHHDHG